MSFLRSEADRRLKNNDLIKLKELIDWQALRPLLAKIKRSGYGPKGYDPLKLLKALILQAWHSLSDPGLEDALKVRLDFMMFTGLEEQVPDETTFCKFRQVLQRAGLFTLILEEINQQLLASGLAVKPSAGAVLDATIIQSAARPRKELEGIALDRQEDTTKIVVKPDQRLSVDPDASWLKKGNRSYFGFKGFMVSDVEDGYIRKIHVTPAHISEVCTLADALGELRPERLYTDKGYASVDNRRYLQSKGIKNGIMFKANRDKALSLWQKSFNKLISKRRYIVEQGFGTLKRRFCMGRASYLGTMKVQAQMVLKAIAFNLLKGLRKAYSPT
jgi:IS5 family transposase